MGGGQGRVGGVGGWGKRNEPTQGSQVWGPPGPRPALLRCFAAAAADAPPPARPTREQHVGVQDEHAGLHVEQAVVVPLKEVHPGQQVDCGGSSRPLVAIERGSRERINGCGHEGQAGGPLAGRRQHEKQASSRQRQRRPVLEASKGEAPVQQSAAVVCTSWYLPCPVLPSGPSVTRVSQSAALGAPRSHSPGSPTRNGKSHQGVLRWAYTSRFCGDGCRAVLSLGQGMPCLEQAGCGDGETPWWSGTLLKPPDHVPAWLMQATPSISSHPPLDSHAPGTCYAGAAPAWSSGGRPL